MGTSHIDLVDTEARRLDLGDWFARWRAAVARRHEPDELAADHLLPLRETILEALSDSSAEQFLGPLTARHLRRYGRARFAETDLWFWVRTEWGKVDLCYGVAPKGGFAGQWNPAWERGDTGDLGQLEVKVCYRHETPGDRRTKLDVLASQLEARRQYDRKTEGFRGKRVQRYHGLVWLFQHGGSGDELTGIANELEGNASECGLNPFVGFAKCETHHELGRLWPAFGGQDYACHLDLAMFELA